MADSTDQGHFYPKRTISHALNSCTDPNDWLILTLHFLRTANGIVAEALRLATVVANDRLAGKGGSGGSSGGSGGSKKGNPADVIELTSSVFNKEVSFQVVIIVF